MSDIEIQLGHLNIADPVLKRIRKYCSKKQKTLQKKKNKDTKHVLKVKKLIEKLARDIIELCKLQKAVEPRRKIGYNPVDIMIREETSIAEKVIKLFPKENIVLNKKFTNRKSDIWFKNHNVIIEVDEGNHENYESDDGKEREEMFTKHSFKTFRCNPNDPIFDLFKFLDEINLHISKLRKKMM